MEIPYTVTARPDTGLYNAKVGIWLFLASEVMLFGGLFSGYIFLRIGADYPWPEGVLNNLLGFINTLVLIASSVTVVMAWASLKMRQWNRYVLYMSITLLCAATFMVIKAFEYTDKLTHYGLHFSDGSIVEGYIDTGADFVVLKDVTSVRFDTTKGAPNYVLRNVLEGEPVFLNKDGVEINLNRSYLRTLARGSERLGIAPAGSVELTLREPITIGSRASRLMNHSDEGMTFRDGTVVNGTLERDHVTMRVDRIDTRMAEDPTDNMALQYLGDTITERFRRHAQFHIDDFNERYADRGFDPMENAELLRTAYRLKLPAPDLDTVKRGRLGGSSGDDALADGKDKYPQIQVEREDVRFYSNFSPAYSTYYAIYFTLTGLHGLHVICGALVLGYFMVFGKKMYQRNPEHLANRVEVGGLFWHFVDLVWIFLFPVLYLM